MLVFLFMEFKKINKPKFSNRWFSNGPKSVWDQLILNLDPSKILEIGCFEGASTCYLVENISRKKKIEIHCIDNWIGGLEHNHDGIDPIVDMNLIYNRFKKNIELVTHYALHKPNIIVHKENSDLGLSKLFNNGFIEYFDFIYIDGSHQAPDVLLDAVLSFRLLKKNGIMGFDDYLWKEASSRDFDPIRSPKIAIDAFTNIYCRKINIIPTRVSQIYVQKISN